MPSRSKSRGANNEIAQIEKTIGELQDKLSRLNESTQRGTSRAATDVNDFVSDALETIVARFQGTTNAATEEVAERAAKAGSIALRQMMEEVEHYPLATLAIAAGIGYLLGSART
jgi:ElaB/YqjD/DUF883 family membrane-anchored ribosome-binding protein